MTDATSHDTKAGDARKIPTSWWPRVGHDLRGPIGPIRMAMQLLRTGMLPAADQSDAWKLIDRQLDVLLAGVDDVSDLMRIEAGRFDFRPQRADLRDMFDLLDGRGKLDRDLASSGASLRVESWPAPLFSMYDARHLTTVLEFLVLKVSGLATTPGSILLSLRREPSAAVWTIQGATSNGAQDVELRFVAGESSLLGDCEGRALLVRELAAMHAIEFRALRLEGGLEFTMPLQP